MSLRLDNKVAIVTGAGRGIGCCIGAMLAKAGARVAAVARTVDELEKAAAAMRQEGGDAVAIPADVSVEDHVTALFLRVHKELGPPDILINNAGIGIYGLLAEFSAADFDKVVATNLRGTFLCCREAIKLMAPRRTGYIINISSVVGFKGYPRQSAYTAAKHGVMGLTKSLAIEAQEYGIRVSAILPGGVDTQMIRSSRPDLSPSELMKPEDVAQTVAYLLSLSERAAVDQIYLRRRNSAPF